MMHAEEWKRRTEAWDLGPSDQLDLLEVADEMVSRGYTSTDPLEDDEREQFARDYARVQSVHPTDSHVYVVFENTHAWLIPGDLTITAYKPN